MLVFLLLLLVQLQTQVLASTRLSPSMVAKQACKDKCGNLTIPYPFGIGKGCYFGDPFEIICNDTINDSSSLVVAYNPWIDGLIYHISMDTVRTGMPFVTVFYNKSSGKNVRGDQPLQTTTALHDGYYFTISATWNKFIAVGCDIFAYFKDSQSGENLSGCASFCNATASYSSSCTGNNGCCESSISRMPELLNPDTKNCPGQPPDAFGEVALEWVISKMSCQQAPSKAKNVPVKTTVTV